LSSVYRLRYPDGSYRDKIYLTKGHAKIARAVLASEDDLVIEELSGDWVVVDNGQPELYGRLRMLAEWGVRTDMKNSIERVMRHLTEDQLRYLHLHKMSNDEIALETSDAVVYATPQGFRYAGFKIYESLVPGTLLGRK
jgi:hypothetical protein